MSRTAIRSDLSDVGVSVGSKTINVTDSCQKGSMMLVFPSVQKQSMSQTAMRSDLSDVGVSVGSKTNNVTDSYQK
ncbi:hypothetical protein TNCV_1465561 [Trichonephila clavipes]|nr:hypothetical protein TNCV_1465561 [Trichonephila clavipes]